jgi:putative ABC transport system permease protein
MNLSDQLRGVRDTLVLNRTRSLLTLLGVVIGTGSIVLLSGVLRSGEQALIHANQGATDGDLIRVYDDEPPAKDRLKTQRPLSHEDGALLRDSPVLKGARTETETLRATKALWRGKERRISLIGAVPSAKALYRLQMAKGRFLDEDDLASGRRVCVVGDEVWKDLGAVGMPLGEVHLEIDGHLWSVVGVLEHKPSLGNGDGTWKWDRRVLVPRSAYEATFGATRRADAVFVRLSESSGLRDRMGFAGKLIEATLLRRHLGVKNFVVRGDDAGKSTEETVVKVIELLLLGTGLLSLLVGGINIMNIMLVTVTERTKEIGLRRSLGATPGSILGQFLLEAASIAGVGAMIGVTGGLGLSWVLSLVLDQALGGWAFHVEPLAIAASFALALTVGVGFGLAPALRAARMDPVTALRHE